MATEDSNSLIPNAIKHISYSCSACKLTFARESDVKEHIQTRTCQHSAKVKKTLKPDESIRSESVIMGDVDALYKLKENALSNNCSEADSFNEHEFVEVSYQLDDQDQLSKECLINNETKNKSTDSLRSTADTKEVLVFVCFSCNKCFKQKKNFNYHLIKHHEAIAENTVVKAGEPESIHCFPCNESFSSRQNFDEHECTRDIQYKVFFPQEADSSDVNEYIEVSSSCTDDLFKEQDSNDEQPLEDHTIWLTKETSTMTPLGELLSLVLPEDDRDDSLLCLNEKRSKTRRKVKRTFQKNHDKKVYTCPICFKDTFSDHAHLKTHICYHSKYPYSSKTCKICGKSFLSSRNLFKHIQSVHEKIKSSVCEICGKHLAHESQLKTHMLHVHSDIRPFLCSECGRSFKRKDHLQNHVNVVHTKSKLFVCSQCGKHFSAKPNLISHELHHQKCNYKCVECGQEFSSRTKLDQHKLAEHGITSELMTLLESDETPKSKEKDEVPKNNRKQSLPASKKKRFTCKTCNTSFKEQKYLFSHEKLHTNPKQYSCHVCEKNFLENKRLRYHMITHAKVKPYACSQCEKSFTDRRMLKVHELNHQGIKPYACNLCNIRFSSKGSLHRHDLVKHKTETINI